MKTAQVARLASTVAAAVIAGLGDLDFSDLPSASAPRAEQPITRIRMAWTAAERARIGALPRGEQLAAIQALSASPSARRLAPVAPSSSSPSRPALAPEALPPSVPLAVARAVQETPAAAFARANGLDVERFTGLHAQLTNAARPAAVTASTLTPYQRDTAARFGLTAEAFAARFNALPRRA